MEPLALAAAAATGLLQLLKYAFYTFLAVLVYTGVNPIKRWRYRHIPGPFGLPLLGNLAQLGVDYLRFMTAMRKKHGRIFKVWLGSQPWVIICDPDATRKMTSRLNHHLGLPNTMVQKERTFIDSMLVFLTPEPWKVMKKAWGPVVLHKASLEGYAPLMQECADELVARLEALSDGEPVDIHEEIGKTIMDIVGTIAFGVKFSDSSRWVEEQGLTSHELRATAQKFLSTMDVEKSSAWSLPMYIFPDSTELIRRLASRNPDAGHRLMVEGMNEISEAAQTLIKAAEAQRKRAGGDAGGGDAAGGTQVMQGSFVERLEAWRSKHEGSMEISDSLLAAQVANFVLGGYESTTHSLGYLMYCLATHPEAQQKLQQELDTVLGSRKPTLEDLPKLVYLDACLKESARVHSTAFGTTRVYHGHSGDPPSFELMGKAIPQGTVLMALTFDMHRDPEYWERPEEFLPERFLPEVGSEVLAQRENAMFQFGHGARKCIGYKFAEQEMALVAAALLRRFSLRRPPGEGPVEPKLGVFNAPKGGVRVLLHTRG